jgi:hypothetical protein
VEHDRRRVAAGRERRLGTVRSVLRRRADRGADPRAGGLGRLGTLLALALGGRIMEPVDTEAKAAAGAAV